MKNNFTIYIFSECDLNGNLFVANHYALKDLNSVSSVHSSPSKSSQWTWECRSLGKIKKLEIMKIHQLMIAICFRWPSYVIQKGQFQISICINSLWSKFIFIMQVDHYHYFLFNKNYWVVSNAGFTRSRNTWKHLPPI